jgi:thiol-disulfide isomerase/thioredoxin
MTTPPQLPVEGVIPPLDRATAWLNSEPLTEAELLGRPVLVEFWTFTCINWIRTLPYVRAWFEKYRDDGLVVIGVHTPEFAVERDIDNITRAAGEMRVDFPIAVDSDYSIWRAFGNQYWPALYFIDMDGQIRHHRFGEGEYEYSEIVIQRLLAAAGAAGVSREPVSIDPQGVEAQADWDDLRSPETYLGYRRAENFASPGGAHNGERHGYELPAQLRLNQWALSGAWTIGGEAAALEAEGGRIAHRFHARDLHLVMGPGQRGEQVRFRVLLDGGPPGTAHGADTNELGEGTVTGPRLYQLIRQPGRVVERTFEIAFLDAGARAYVFTFG